MTTHYKNLTHIFSLLPQKSRRNLLLLSIFQLNVALLDVAAIFLLGLISKSGLEYIQNGISEMPFPMTNLFGLNSRDFEIQFAILSIVILILFSARTAVSIWGYHRILRYLGNQGTIASNSLLNEVLSSDPQYVVRKNSQELLYSLTSGIDLLVLNYLRVSLLGRRYGSGFCCTTDNRGLRFAYFRRIFLSDSKINFQQRESNRE
jgi:hypothetical protein